MSKRRGATINIVNTENGMITEASAWYPISSDGKVWELNVYSWSENLKQYEKATSVIHADDYSHPKKFGPTYYSNSSTVSLPKAFEELREFVTDHNKLLEIRTEILGRSSSYQQFCNALENCEKLYRATCSFEELQGIDSASQYLPHKAKNSRSQQR